MDDQSNYAVVSFPPAWAARPYGWLMRRIRRWFYFAHVTTRPLLETPQLLPPEGIEVRYPTQAELREASAREDMLLNLSRTEASLARGDICTASYSDGEMIGYAWSAYTMAPHIDEIWIEFQPPYRYGYKSFVHPDYRGKRVSNGMAAFSDADSIRKGFTHAISFVETHNYKSIRSNRRHPGREFIGFAGYLNLFGRIIPFRTPAVKNLGFRFVPPEEATAAMDSAPAT